MIRKHWGAILLAVLAGAITAFPQVISEKRIGDAYQGVYPTTSEDELYYLARAQETLDGHPFLGSPYFLEDKNNPGVQFWMPDAFFASVNNALFGDQRPGILMWDFLIPFGIVLSAYAILYLLTADILISLAATTLIEPGQFFLEYNRSPNPQLFFVLLLSLLLLLLYFRTKERWYAIGAAVVGGALFHIYPFYWTYWVVLMGIAVVATFLFLRETKAWKSLMLIFGGGIVIGIPYFIDAYKATLLPYYHESLIRIGVNATHFPSGITVVAFTGCAFLIFIWCWWRRIVPRSIESILIGSASLTGVVVMNQHIITGINYQFTVHYTMPAIVMSIFLLAYCFHALLARCATNAHIGILAPSRMVFLLVSVVYAFVHTFPIVNYIATPHAIDFEIQRYGPVLDWLDEHTETDDVVYASRKMSPYITALTKDNVFFSQWAYLSFMPQANLEKRFLGAHYFEKPFTREEITDHELTIFGPYYMGQYQHAQSENKLRTILGIAPLAVDRYPEERMAQLVEQGRIVQKGSFKNALGGYRVDYLVWDSKTDPAWSVTKVSGLTQVFSKDGMFVYKVSSL